MDQILAEKAFALWGPFAMVVVLLLLALYILGKQYLSRQKSYEERDEKRLSMFMQTTAEFTRTASDNNVILSELKEMVSEAHTMLVKINERF